MNAEELRRDLTANLEHLEAALPVLTGTSRRRVAAKIDHAKFLLTRLETIPGDWIFDGLVGAHPAWFIPTGRHDRPQTGV